MPIDPVARAVKAYELILDKPSSVVFTKPRVVNGDGTVTAEVVLAAQVCRVNSDNRASVIGGEAGLNPKRTVIVYGVLSHPTAPANDIKEGYTFLVDGELYRVAHVIPNTPGVVQAQAALV